jgi:hypothetical protein
MLTKNKPIIAIKLVIIMLIFNGCDKIVEIELADAEQMIVVNTILNPDSLILVNLTRNRHILDNADIPPLEEPDYQPIARLYVNDTYVEDLKAVGYGNYISTVKPEIGFDYFLEVSEPKYNTVSTSTSIPNPVAINYFDTSSITHDFDDSYYSGMSADVLNCKIAIDDPVNEKNYYLLKFEVNYSRWEVHDTSYFVVDSALVDDKWIYDFREITNYEKYARHSNPSIYYGSNDISAEFIVDGGGYAFSDDFFNGNVYEFSTSILASNLYSLDSTIVTANLLSLSEDYYKYLKSRWNHYSSKNDFFATPVPVYNNINGGVGIMGSYSSSKTSFTVKIINPYNEPYSY